MTIQRKRRSGAGCSIAGHYRPARVALLKRLGPWASTPSWINNFRRGVVAVSAK
jgi:hypothetical protein